MAFAPPTFNLQAAVWRYDSVNAIYSLFGLFPCNAAFGRRVFIAQPQAGDDQFPLMAQLLFPAGTDLRDSFMAIQQDLLEVPQGSTRWYYCMYVNDLGTGFANEHRLAIGLKAPIEGAWIAPLPAIYGVGPPPLDQAAYRLYWGDLLTRATVRG